MFQTLGHLRRLRTIARTLARHDALFPFEPFGPIHTFLKLTGPRPDPRLRQFSPGHRLAAALQALGPSFIKLGQTLATRADLIGEEMAADLSQLQDRLPPFPGAIARAAIAADLMQPLELLYSSFDDTPVAAASIAQVHFATTIDGDPVAVKVLRPGIANRMAEDVALFTWLASWADRLRPRLRRLHLNEMVKTLADAVALELDLRFEAAAASETSENFEGDATFRVPEIDWQRTGLGVLTLTRVHGIRIDDIPAIRTAGIDPTDVLQNLANALFRMVFRDGFFHADLHPGNLFVAPDGAVVAVDFGITGRVDPQTRRFLAELLVGFLNRDYRRVAEIHFEAGILAPDRSIDAFTQAIRSIAEPILEKPLKDISIARLLGQLFQVTEHFQMELQPQMLLLQKTMLQAEGVGRRLDPSVNMWEVSRPLMERWMTDQFGPRARIQDSLGDIVDTLERLPRVVRETEMTVAALRQGVRLHPDSERAINKGRRARGIFPNWMPWILAAALAYLLYRR